MFQRILVPLDGSHRAERAVPVAARIARNTGGSIVLLRVVTIQLDMSWAAMKSAGGEQQIIDNECAEARDYLTAMRRADELTDIAVQTEVLLGEPALTIFTTARFYDADPIVMGSHGKTGFQGWLMGSVAQKVAHHSSVPILVLREDSEISFQIGRPLRVLVPLDDSAIAEAAIVPAASLCEALSAPSIGELHLVHVISEGLPGKKAGKNMEIAIPGYSLLTGTFPQQVRDPEEDIELFEARKRALLAEASVYMKTISQRLSQEKAEGDRGIHVNISSSVVIDTDIASAIIDHAEHGKHGEEGTGIGMRCDLIAMTTHGHGGLRHWPTGSVTDRVLGATKLPLLIVRPQALIQQKESVETALESEAGLS